MTAKTINQLPHGEYRELMKEAMERGKKCILGEYLPGTDIILIGVIDIVKDLHKEIATLKEGQDA